jgi:hypothetical protein
MKKILAFILLSSWLLFLLPGCLVLNIEPELQNPMTITFDGVKDVLQLGDTMNVTAIVEDEYGNKITPDKYEWYLDGNQLSEKSNNLVIGSDLIPDQYTLDLVVIKDSILSSDSVGFQVIE